MHLNYICNLHIVHVILCFEAENFSQFYIIVDSKAV